MTNSTGLTPAVRIILLAAGAAVVLWGMSNYAGYINSAMLAVLIVLACGPLIERLRKRLPKVAVLLITLLLAIVVLGIFLVFMIYAGVEFAAALPAYKEQAESMVQQLQSWLQSLGFAPDGAAAVAQTADPSGALDWAARLLAAIGSLLGSGVTLAMIMIFLFVDVVLFPGRLAWQGEHRSSYAKRVADYTGDLRQYIVVMVILGTAVGIANTIFFFFMGVPMPLLWGVLSGILNFIPFIGFWFGLIPPTVLTLFAFGWERMLLVAVGYILINATVQNVIQPKLVVSRLNLTPLMSLISSTFWPLVLGPVGAIIGVPLTMSVRSLLLDADPSTRWLADVMCTTIPAEQPLEAAKPPKDAAVKAAAVGD
jgi:predicted PurR-regulated permease PerM